MLTNREIDVLILLSQRLSDKEIAERLVLSPVTIKKHEQRIYRKPRKGTRPPCSAALQEAVDGAPGRGRDRRQNPDRA